MDIINNGINIQITYKNHEGRISIRTIRPLQIWCGISDYHPQWTRSQMFLQAYDCDRKENRDFRMNDILTWDGVRSHE